MLILGLAQLFCATSCQKFNFKVEKIIFEKKTFIMILAGSIYDFSLLNKEFLFTLLLEYFSNKIKEKERKETCTV